MKHCNHTSQYGDCPDLEQEKVTGVDGVERGFCTPHAIEARDGIGCIARKVREMLQRRQRGELKKTADDFISGLIEAYQLVLGLENVEEAYQRIMDGVSP